MLCGSAERRPRMEERHRSDLTRQHCWQGWQWSPRRSAAVPGASSHNPLPRPSTCRRSRPATPSLTRRHADATTSRSRARRSPSRRSGAAARAELRRRLRAVRGGHRHQGPVDQIGSSHETVLQPASRAARRLTWPCWRSRRASWPYGPRATSSTSPRSWTPRSWRPTMPTTRPLTAVGDNIWGIPYKVDVKAVVWYPIKAFEAAGYEVPRPGTSSSPSPTKIVADGSAPVLRRHRRRHRDRLAGDRPRRGGHAAHGGPEVYDKWISHELPFNSPEVKAAIDLAGADLLHARLRAGRQHRHHGARPDRRWTRCSRLTATGTASPRAAGCTSSRSGTARTSSPTSARGQPSQVHHRRGHRHLPAAARRPGAEPGAAVPVTPSSSSTTAPRSAPSPSSSRRRPASRRGSSSARRRLREHEPSRPTGTRATTRLEVASELLANATCLPLRRVAT